MSDASQLTRPPASIPTSFFEAPGSREIAIRDKLGSPPPSGGTWQPQKAMYWYDSIIDWMFAHPGGSLKECASDLGRHAVTIGLIVRSDLFKSRYAQRRSAFNEELDHRLVGKLANVAEKGLDLMLQVMDKKRDTIPLPLLNDITKTAMDRLGYSGPSRSDSPANSVNVNITNGPSQSVTVSADALARARSYMRQLEHEGGRVEASPPLVEDPVRSDALRVPSEGEL